MSEPCCTATTRTGQPCAAQPLPGSAFCLFHDPAHQAALAESRSKGGATPRRRIRRYPLLLDYRHLAELLSELFVAALNEPAPLDAPRLRALTGLAAVLLKTVGRPKNTYEIHEDRSEITPEEDSLLRIYPPDPPELAHLLAAEAKREEDAELEAPIPHHDPSDPSDPSDPTPAPEPMNVASSQPPALNPQPPTSNAQQAPEQAPEQGGNRAGTGTLATDLFPIKSLSPALAGLVAPPASRCGGYG